MERNSARFVIVLFAAVLVAGCYALRPSSGGGQTDFEAPRKVSAADVVLPPGYRIEPLATGLTFPTAAVFDDENRLYIVEAGYSYGEKFGTPRLLRVEPDGRTTEIARGDNPPWTGASFHNGAFYVSEGGTPGRVLRVGMDGRIERIVDNLPGRTDHFTNRPVMGPDGWLYFGQGSATNSGVVGEDNAKLGWLKRSPEMHDIACRDVTLAGENYTTPDVRQSDAGGETRAPEKVRTGAFVPFGTETHSGQVVRGRVPCTSAIMRVRPEGGPVELVAWGLRHPYGLAFAPDGALYVTDNSYDERGSRPVWGAGDYLWRIKQDTWYGFPDYAGGQPITEERFKAPGKPAPKFVLAQHPQKPPRPVAEFGVHSSSSGIDFSRNPRFGYEGQAFVAQFGDMAKNTGKVLHPVGFRVVRVDIDNGVVEEFAANRGKLIGPASWLGNGGLERPLDVRFDRDGAALYIVDFGVMTLQKEGPRAHEATGVVWRVTREVQAASTGGTP